MRISPKVVAMAVGASALAGAAHANMIRNGDFSNPNVGGGYAFFATLPGGWVNDNSDTLEVGTSTIYGLPCATAACQNLEVNANTFDTVSQTVSGLTVGETYDLSWLYGGRPGGGTQVLDVSFGGAPVTSDTGSIGVWTLNSFEVTATSTTETLTFASEVTDGLPSYGNELTDVSLVTLPVPEPAAWAMMLAGFGGLGAAMRARRRIRATA
jgi:hypothetical protein